MKTFLSLILSLFLVTTIISCGPSEAEKAAAEKAKNDSIVKATEEVTRKKVAEEKATADSIAQAKAAVQKAIQDSIDFTTKRKAQLEQALSDANTQLKIENEKLAHIKEFKLGRTSSEKDAQIAAQYKIIQRYEDQIRKINEEMAKK